MATNTDTIIIHDTKRTEDATITVATVGLGHRWIVVETAGDSVVTLVDPQGNLHQVDGDDDVSWNGELSIRIASAAWAHEQEQGS